MPGRRRPIVAIAVAALCALPTAAGCGSGADGDPLLAVYLSAPISGPDAGDGVAVVRGARQALDDADGAAAGTAVRIVALDDAGDGGASDALAGANARRATEDSTAIAYVGELGSGTTRTSLPITNQAGLLQVSAGASAVDLTRAAPGSDQIPEEVQPSGSRTFGRVIPSDTVQGAAAASWMADRGVRSVAVVDDEGAYGAALLDGLESVDHAPAIAPPGARRRADGIYDVSATPTGGAAAVGAGRALFGADAQISDSPPKTTLPPGAQIISGTMAPSQLPAGQVDLGGGGRFTAYGYEAMAVVLDAIDRADDPLDRGAVVDAFFATTDRESVLGTYSIDDVGDTTLTRVGAYETTPTGRLTPAAAPIAVP